MTPPLNQSVIVHISPEFQEHIPAAILRMRYKFPNLECSPHPNGLKVSGNPDANDPLIARELTYLVYREKIYKDTLPMRQDLYQMLSL